MEHSISNLIPLTYSMLVNNIDSDKEGNRISKYNYLNLQNLVKKLKLDIELIDGISYFNRPAFISKSYYQSGSLPFSYNYPPLGPIPKYFWCVQCQHVGTEYHSVNCDNPFESSLYVTKEGAQKNTEYKEGQSYNEVIKKRGQKRAISTSTKVDKFFDSVTLVYENDNQSRSVIRISKNGVINIISASHNESDLPQKIINKINESNSGNGGNRVINDEEYGSGSIRYESALSYKYLISAQFYIFSPELKKLYYVNLGILDSILNTLKSGNYMMYYGKKYILKDYFYNSGDKTSKLNKMTNPYISFNLIVESFKVNVMVLLRGTVQLKGSHLDSKVKEKQELSIKILDDIYKFLKQIFKDIDIIVPENTSSGDDSIKLYDGKKPQLCHNRDGNRPVPYSFYGTCSKEGYYVKPMGMKRSDGKYEPCCFKIKKTGKDSRARINNILLNGYPDAIDSDIIPNPDTLVANYIPGTKKLESRRFKGLSSFDKQTLMNCIESHGYISKRSMFMEYKSLQKEVLDKYNELHKSVVLQKSVSLNLVNFSESFSKKPYIVTPINCGTIRVVLFFDSTGKSYFINNNMDIIESSLDDVSELALSIIEGYLYPFEDELQFFPVDIIYVNNKDLSKYPFVSNAPENRFRYLMDVSNLINSTITQSGNTSVLLHIIEERFDFNIVQGPKFYLENKEKFGDICGLLFIPTHTEYKKGVINYDLLHWYNVSSKSNHFISLNVEWVSGIRWKISFNANKISSQLIPQKDETISISTDFVKKQNGIKKGTIILFKINIKKNGFIDNDKPLIPENIIPEHINDYNEVLNILNSIKNPVNISTFMNLKEIDSDVGLNLGTDILLFNNIYKPLTKVSSI